jgi:adenosylhomocysteine nucleosidase
MKRIAFIAAIKQEIQPILKRFPAAVQTRLDNLTAWHFTPGSSALLSGYSTVKFGNKPDGRFPAKCLIVESGMGTANAMHATSAALESFKPDMVISIGFCGALRTGISTGDLVLAGELFLHKDGTLQPQTGLLPVDEYSPALQTVNSRVCRGTFITTEAMVSKDRITALLDDSMQNPVLEMESSAVARICINAGIQFAALRAVSDPVDEDPFQLAYDIIGPDFTVDSKRALVSLLRTPSHLPQLLRLMRNSRLAANSLAGAVSNLLESTSCN